MSIPMRNPHTESNELIRSSGDGNGPGESRALSAAAAHNENVSELPGLHMMINRLERVLVDLRYLAADAHELETQADVVNEMTRRLASSSLSAACTAVQMSLALLQPPL